MSTIWASMHQAGRRKCWVRRARCSPCAKGLTWPVLSAVFVKRPVATMRFRTLNTRRATVKLESHGVAVDRRWAVVCDAQILRNSGTNRTPSKRALLNAIEHAGGQW